MGQDCYIIDYTSKTYFYLDRGNWAEFKITDLKLDAEDFLVHIFKDIYRGFWQDSRWNFWCHIYECYHDGPTNLELVGDYCSMSIPPKDFQKIGCIYDDNYKNSEFKTHEDLESLKEKVKSQIER